MAEHTLLDQAALALHKETGLELELIDRKITHADAPWADALLRLDDLTFRAEVKKRAGQINTGMLLQQLRHLDDPREGLLITDYINPRLADRLRLDGIQFVDTAGNVFINRPPVFLFIKGNRKTDEMVAETPVTGRAFKPVGLKVMFAVLNDPALLNAPYRDIANRAQVALGNVGWILRELVNMGYVEEGIRTAEKKITRLNKLMEKWVEMYPIVLRPKLVLGKFTTTDPLWYKTIDPTDFAACWGGELAAWQYDKHLNPGKFTVYLDKQKLNAFAKAARLKKWSAERRDEQEILILEKFWSIDTPAVQPQLAPPLLVYTDLVETGDPRNLEAAERIRARYLA